MLKVNELHPQYLTNEGGEKIAVVLPLKIFEELLEDMHDLAVVAERANEAVISHEDLKAELKKDGKL